VDRHADDAAKSSPERAANENLVVESSPVLQPMSGQRIEVAHGDAKPLEQQAGTTVAPLFRPIEQSLVSEVGGAVEVPHIETPQQVSIAPIRGVSDLVASGIGGAASYLADQLGELFAPTPPEVREAQAKADAKQVAERPAQQPERDDKAAAYARIIDSAVRLAETERAQENDSYWKERDRGKGFERDQ
jgi:hypothetical protein